MGYRADLPGRARLPGKRSHSGTGGLAGLRVRMMRLFQGGRILEPMTICG